MIVYLVVELVYENDLLAEHLPTDSRRQLRSLDRKPSVTKSFTSSGRRWFHQVSASFTGWPFFKINGSGVG